MPKQNAVPMGLHRRKKSWYIKLHIPMDIQAAFGRTKHLVKSTGCRDQAQARRVALRMVADIHDQFDRIRNDRPDPTPGHPSLRPLLAELNAIKQRPHNVDPELFDTLLTVAHDIDGQLSEAEQEDLVHAFKCIQNPQALTVREAVTRYLKESQAHVLKQTLATKERRLYAFMDHIGKRALLRDVTRQVAGGYAEHLQGLVLAGEKSTKTVKDVLGELSTFFNWCTVRGMAEVNPFHQQARTIKDSTRGTSEGTHRRPWEPEELHTLFTSSIPADLKAAAAIGLYSGMRLNEICELTLSDVKDGCFHVTAGKSASAVRKVPVHPAIQSLVNHLLATSPDGYLIPDQIRGGRDRKRSWNTSKRFSRYVRLQLGIKDPGVVFHSLRKNMTTALEQARVPRNEIELILGWHRDGLAYGRYSAGVNLETLKGNVESITYGEVVDEVVAGRIGELVG